MNLIVSWDELAYSNKGIWCSISVCWFVGKAEEIGEWIKNQGLATTSETHTHTHTHTPGAQTCLLFKFQFLQSSEAFKCPQRKIKVCTFALDKTEPDLHLLQLRPSTGFWRKYLKKTLCFNTQLSMAVSVFLSSFLYHIIFSLLSAAVPSQFVFLSYLRLSRGLFLSVSKWNCLA